MNKSCCNRRCTFRFYEELNDFLAPELRRRSFEHAFDGRPTVKDRIEAQGVPHTEVDLILVDGESVDFTHRVRGGERVAVYPVFEAFDIGAVTRLRPEPLRDPRFILDVHLGRLAAFLRLLSFDCHYGNDLDDAQIIDRALDEHRIILTRDAGILMHSRVTHGAFVHTTEPMRQVRETVDRFQLERGIRPWTRCMKCNGRLAVVKPEALSPGEVPPRVRARYDGFRRCEKCGRVYWPGSHVERIRVRFAEIGLDLEASRFGMSAPGAE